MLQRLLRLALLLGAVGACRGEPRARETTAPSAGSAAPAAASASASSAAPASASAPSQAAPSASSRAELASLDAAKVRAFVARWVELQNAHDFAAYSALYAERFSGLKRVGSYAKRFDRRGWLKDREPMLHAGSSVRVSELQVTPTPGAARVVFTQDFSAPGFQDTGQKELFLLAAGTGIVISREEMRLSRVAKSAPAAGGALFAFHRDGIVLESDIALSTLPTKPRLLAHQSDDVFVVAASVDPAELSESTRGWLGRSVTVYAKDGTRCSGAVARFELRVAVVPHFGMIQAWNGEADQPKASPTQIATEIWNVAREEERFVVGVLDHACHGQWATEGAPSWLPARPAAAALRATAVAAFKALPRYAELQAAFVTENSDTQHAWEEVDGELSVVQVRAATEPALVVVSARAGSGCNSFSGALTAIWRVAAGGALELRQVIDNGSGLLQTHGAIDNGKGLELLTGPDGLQDEVWVLQPTATGYERRLLFSTAFWDCGC